MSIKIEYLSEPKLQFGEYFEHEDTKTGLAEFGPFGRNVDGLHPSQIRLGFIGTRETVSDAKEWIAACGGPIESENVRPATIRTPLSPQGLFDDFRGNDSEARRCEKILNRDFVGFTAESSFKSCFQMNNRWDKTIPAAEIQAILNILNKEERIKRLVDVFDANIKILAETGPAPDIIILALTPEIVEQAHSVQISGNFYLNFRRAIKAKSMRWGVPIQLIQPRDEAVTSRKRPLAHGIFVQRSITKRMGFLGDLLR